MTKQTLRDLPPSPAFAPTFGLLRPQPPRTGAFLLGTLISLVALVSVSAALQHSNRLHRRSHAGPGSPSASSPSAGAAGVPPPSSSDDPDAFDTIVLADPGDAPSPAAPDDGRPPSPVHPFAVVHLPRFGPEVGMIPDTPTGRALYRWLAAFNQQSAAGLAEALPSASPGPSVAGQLALRDQTRGLALISARELAPGLMVFRMRDQATQTEALGTLQLRSSTAPSIASFSLRAIASP